MTKPISINDPRYKNQKIPSSIACVNCGKIFTTSVALTEQPKELSFSYYMCVECRKNELKAEEALNKRLKRLLR